MEHLAGLRQLAPDYDGFVVDLWGVVHNGVALLPGAHDCLGQLRDAGKRVVFLSNAPRRAAIVHDILRRMGVPDAWHIGVVTSGEVTRTLLIERSDPFVRALGRRVFHFGAAKDAGVLDGTGLEIVPLERAAFILNTGPDDDGLVAEASWRPLLEAAAARQLPMVCANPDIDVVRGTQRVWCAGAVARVYEIEHGGAVRRIGKPDPVVYGPAFELLGCPPQRTLAIGDALATDMLGARGAGIDGAWVLGGIHADLAGHPDLADAETEREGLAPRASLPGLIW